MKKSYSFKQKCFIVAAFCLGTGTLSAQYCEPSVNCTDGDLLTWVSFSNIDNFTECSTDGYGDYTESVEAGIVEAGESYLFSADVGGGWSFETVAVWIDFDNSQTFDESEFFLIGTGSASTVSADIMIPSGTAEGLYRMRVSVLASDAPFDDPCYFDTSNYGEFEDYMIEVANLGVSDLQNASSLSVVKSGQDLIVESKQSPIKDIQVFDLSGKLISNVKNVQANRTSIQLGNATQQIIIVKAITMDGKTISKKFIF